MTVDSTGTVGAYSSIAVKSSGLPPSATLTPPTNT